MPLREIGICGTIKMHMANVSHVASFFCGERRQGPGGAPAEVPGDFCLHRQYLGGIGGGPKAILLGSSF